MGKRARKKTVAFEVDGREVRVSSREAWRLIKSGQANIVSESPFTIRARDRAAYCSTLARWGARSYVSGRAFFVMNGSLIGKVIGGGIEDDAR